jgi:hypothetical protein
MQTKHEKDKPWHMYIYRAANSLKKLVDACWRDTRQISYVSSTGHLRQYLKQINNMCIHEENIY